MGLFDFSKRNKKKLFVASVQGNSTRVQILLAKGIDVNTRDEDGDTALIIATMYGHTRVVQTLLDKGAKVNLKNKQGVTALMAAAKEGHSDIMQTLLDKGAKVNLKNQQGVTALMGAALNGHANLVQILLQKGAEVDAKDHHGATALMKGALIGHTDIVQTLLDNGADVNAQGEQGITALMAAESQGHTNIVQLLNKRTQVNATDNNDVVDSTAAARKGHVKEESMHFTFNGVEYYHRWSKDGQHEFTPAEQSDLSSWVDMVTINVYENIKNADLLANLANNVLSNYQSGGQIVKIDSKPRTPFEPAEHLIVAVLGQPDLLEAAFARFILIDNVGFGIIYSHRVHGNPAMSAWLKLNGVKVKNALMKWDKIPAIIGI